MMTILFRNIEINLWLVVGFLGQLCFFLRFFIQWLISERNHQSTIPMVFWYLSILGASCVLVYALHRRDPVFIVGQSFGLACYVRNIILRRKRGGP